MMWKQGKGNEKKTCPPKYWIRILEVLWVVRCFMPSALRLGFASAGVYMELVTDKSVLWQVFFHQSTSILFCQLPLHQPSTRIRYSDHEQSDQLRRK
jgi:hypothetical protein